MNRVPSSAVELDALAKLYYESVEHLGAFREVNASEMPEDYQTLLANDTHMTVTLESFHRSPVQVRVLHSAKSETHYQRKVLVVRESDGWPVLFALVRVTRALMDPDVWEAIEGEQIPLGRILISHNVMRNVRPLSLWQVHPGEEIRRLFRMPVPSPRYGRTALIYCDRVPAIEVLEVVQVA